MKTSFAATIAFALATLSAGHAMAAGPTVALTRDQVRAELVEARRTGDVVADDELAYAFGATPGVKLNELFPNNYPAKAAVAGKTRDQVRAELVAAKRSGDVVADSELAYAFGATPGVKLKDLFPGNYAAKATVTGITREQVRAELAEAKRTGDIVANDELAYAFGGAPGAKMNQLFPNSYPVKAAAAKSTVTAQSGN
jgi:hypothetical protein